MVADRLRDAAEWGTEALTIYAFSTENWGRPREEVEGLLTIFGDHVARLTPALHEEGVRLRFLGRRAAPVPAALVERMNRAEGMTAANRRITLFLPFNYGGRAELLDAARSFRDGGEEEFRRHLYAPDMRDPDLVIRTGGERRLSNFLLWQIADSELVFRDELWPDFSREAFAAAVTEFRRRREARLRGA